MARDRRRALVLSAPSPGLRVASAAVMAMLAGLGGCSRAAPDGSSSRLAAASTTSPTVLGATTSTSTGVRLFRALQREFTATSRGEHPTPRVQASSVSSLVAIDDALVTNVPVGRPHTAVARVAIPTRADGVVRVESGGVAASIKPIGVAPSAIEWAEGVAIHPSIQPGVDLYRRLAPDGFEDFYRVQEPRADIAFGFDVSIEGGAGLRLVGGGLELLDAAGTPRLHAAAPVVFDSAGKARRGEVRVDGCAVDRDPRGPWGRPVTAPGASHCTVTFHVSGADLQYPLLVDPSWNATANTRQSHAFHRLVEIRGGTDVGHVLVLGGIGTSFDTTELFDPATETWATSSDLPATSGLGAGLGAVALSDGTVIAAGGLPAAAWTIETTGPSQKNVNRRAPDGTWTAAAVMSTSRAYFALADVTIGGVETVIAAGGETSNDPDATNPIVGTSELYNVLNDSWSTGPKLPHAVGTMASTVLADGTLLLAGGDGEQTGGFTEAVSNVQIFDPSTSTWTAKAALGTARRAALVAPLTVAGEIAVVAGGADPSLTNLSSVEVFDGAAWTTITPTLTSPHYLGDVAALADGRALFIGGSADSDVSFEFGAGASVDVFDPATSIATATVGSFASMATTRVDFAAIHLDATSTAAERVIAVGGLTDGTDGSDTTSVELLDFSIGLPCTTEASTCATGLSCVDGVCCTTSSCGELGVCNAPGHEGVCGLPIATPCTDGSQCATGFCSAGVCCNSACSGTCQQCNAVGNVGTCTQSAVGTDPTGSCVGDPACGPFCDSTGACTMFAASATPCGASVLADGGIAFCATTACDGEGDCAAASATCGYGACVLTSTCDEDAATCTPLAISADNCAIDGSCLIKYNTNPTNICLICDPTQSQTAWSPNPTCVDASVDTGVNDASATDAPGIDAASFDAGLPDSSSADAFVGDSTSGDSAIDASGDAGDTHALPTASACGCHLPGRDGETSMSHSALGLAALAWVVARSRRSATRSRLEAPRGR